jgi:hypothetical protein
VKAAAEGASSRLQHCYFDEHVKGRKNFFFGGKNTKTGASLKMKRWAL